MSHDRRPWTGAQILAFGGIVSSTLALVGGFFAPKLVGAAGAVMLLANITALLVERKRPR